MLINLLNLYESQIDYYYKYEYEYPFYKFIGTGYKYNQIKNGKFCLYKDVKRLFGRDNYKELNLLKRTNGIYEENSYIPKLIYEKKGIFILYSDLQKLNGKINTTHNTDYTVTGYCPSPKPTAWASYSQELCAKGHQNANK